MFLLWIVFLWFAPLWEKMPYAIRTPTAATTNPEMAEAGVVHDATAEDINRSHIGVPPERDPGRFGSGGVKWSTRLSNMTRAFRDSFLLLLASVLINMAGYGVDRSVEAIVWTTFAVGAVWAFAQLFLPRASMVMDAIFSFILLAFGITLFALAFRKWATGNQQQQGGGAAERFAF
ncbi:hypothetical protein HK405_007857 [Cladochytrium tenue]|nr:hypothetical protein HK405_007857 [Cladochytrium tenue]